MSKRRGEEYNWYDLSFEDRADLMADHGEVGKEYAGKIKQVIASSVGFDSHEWGVTLFGSDPTDIKDIVYEMRFDPASSRYGEFGEFYIGRRFPPEDLGAYFAGETVPTPAGDGDTGDTEDGHGHAHGEGHDHAGSGGGSAHGDHPHGEEETSGEGDHPHSGEEGGHGGEDGDDPSDADIRGELADLNIYAGKPSGEDVYATVLYSEADVDELFDEVEGLRGNFDHYGTHVKTAVYEGRVTDRAAVVSIWDTASAAETAAGFLSELPEVVARAGEESGFGTMGMFYTVKPEHQEDFTRHLRRRRGDTRGDGRPRRDRPDDERRRRERHVHREPVARQGGRDGVLRLRRVPRDGPVGPRGAGRPAASRLPGVSRGIRGAVFISGFPRG